MVLPNDPIVLAYEAITKKNLERIKKFKAPPLRFIASELGSCKRKIFYRHSGYIPAARSARGDDYGRDGDVHHDLVRTFMVDEGGAKIEGVKRGKGGLLSEEEPGRDVVLDAGKHRVKLHVRKDGKIRLSRRKGVLEIKSVSYWDYKAYTDLWTNTLDPAAVLAVINDKHPEYIDQCHAGMFEAGLKLAYLVIKGRDSCAVGLHSTRDAGQILGGLVIEWDQNRWNQIVKRMEIVADALREEKPPRAEYVASDNQCKYYCPFLHLCHGALKRKKQGIEPHAWHPQLGKKLHANDIKRRGVR